MPSLVKKARVLFGVLFDLKLAFHFNLKKKSWKNVVKCYNVKRREEGML